MSERAADRAGAQADARTASGGLSPGLSRARAMVGLLLLSFLLTVLLVQVPLYRDLARWIDRLLPASPAERRELAAVSPGRADYLLAGASILTRVLQASRRQQMLVSDRGLRYGLL